MGLDHMEGFENEEKFRTVLFQAIRDCPILKSRTVQRIIAHFASEFTDHLFEVRQCIRKLKYIGYNWCQDETYHGKTTDDFFKIGEEYESVDFNGATYAINGYDNGETRIGSGSIR